MLQALTAHLSLSLCTLSTLQMTTPLLSLPFALANIFRALTAHISLSLHSTHLQITTPFLSLPLALFNISLQRRSRLRTRSLGVRRPSQNTANEALTCARLLPALPHATTSRLLAPSRVCTRTAHCTPGTAHQPPRTSHRAPHWLQMAATHRPARSIVLPASFLHGTGPTVPVRSVSACVSAGAGAQSISVGCQARPGLSASGD